jgi:hypothetical protein
VTVYVLGAGASHHVGYPLCASMGSDLATWMRENTGSPLDYPGTADLLQRTFGTVDNFEELLTHIGALIESYEHGSLEERGLRSAIAFARFTLSQALREWFTEVRQRDASAYRDFANHIAQPGDCILTFNYDVSVERELAVAGKWRGGDGYGFEIECLPSASPVRLLKLHGSTNWLAVMFGGLRGAFALPRTGVFGTRPAFPKPELEFLGYPDAVDPLWPQQSTPLPVMILPARVKQFFFATNIGDQWEWFWDSLWEEARRVLSQTDRIVICGYSLPAADARARQLLLQSAPRQVQVEVSCGGDTKRIVQEFQQIGFIAAAATETYFERWVSAAVV